MKSFSVFVIFPIGVTERTYTSLFEPSPDTVVVKSVIADSPSNYALLGDICLICLAVDAGFHYVALADGAVFNFDVPRPEGYCCPFFNFESLGHLLRVFLVHFA